MSRSYDVIVAGLGAMGSAAAFHLARRGQRVIGLDRYAPPHDRGSSSGRSRIIREAYFEHPAYVPLVQRAYELWRELEYGSGRTLMTPTGGLMIGPPEGELVAGALASARAHELHHEVLDAAALAQRYPGMTPTAETVAVWEPRAGVLFPEACIEEHLRAAANAGAELRGEQPATRWTASDAGVEVVTPHETLTAGALILAAGAWMGELLPDAGLALEVRRQPLFWFEPLGEPERFSPQRFPVFIWEHDPGRFIYGFPDFGDGVKLARHGEGERTAPGSVRRDVTSVEAEEVRGTAERLLPGAIGPPRSAATCLYTNTPDHHFVLDAHPAHPNVWIASPCSGHGFKFSSAIGEILADWVTGREPRFDLGLFRLARFQSHARDIK